MALVEVFVEPEEAQSQQHLIRTHEDKISASAKIVGAYTTTARGQEVHLCMEPMAMSSQ